MHRPRRNLRRGGGAAAPALLAGAGLLLLAIGCGGKKEESPQPAPTASGEPRDVAPRQSQPAPEDQPTFALDTQQAEPLVVPAGVEFPEELRPTDRSLAESIVQAASALASGDAAALASMLDDNARAAFESLQERGMAGLVLGDIQRVRVCALEQRPEEASIALGVQRPDHAALLSLRAAKRGDSWVFQGLTSLAPAIADVVEAFDGVQLAEAPLPESLPDELAPVEEEQQQPTRRSSGPVEGIR